MKNKALTIFIYTILALPIPISLITWLGTIMSVANIGMVKVDNAGAIITVIIAFSSMILAGTYPVTYGFSLVRTLKNRKLKWVSFLPVLHIILTGALIHLWSLCD